MKPNEQKQPTESTVRNVKILSRQGKVVFEARNIESPKAWSDNAVAIAALLYLNRKEGETSVYKMVDRMVSAMRKHGRNRGYWKDGEARQFALKMRHALLEQDVAFSSPVWMNYREKAERATSSCYTLPMADSLDSITANVVVGAKIFQSGGGLGVNLSALRSSKESIRSGCLAPGPVEFMKTIAAFSRVIRSGGKDRNSSVIFILDDDHPDFLKFCEAKRFHETTLPPNCICTVRLSNRFMRAVASGGRGKWILRHRSKKKWEKVPIRKLWNTLADSIMACGEPGIQFSGTIEKWHTCPASGQINTSNPCGEFLFLNETAAVLASLNLLHFVKADMEFNITRFANDKRNSSRREQ